MSAVDRRHRDSYVDGGGDGMTGWELLRHPQARVKRGDTMIPRRYQIPPSKLMGPLGRPAAEPLRCCKSPSRRRVADNAPTW